MQDQLNTPEQRSRRLVGSKAAAGKVEHQLSDPKIEVQKNNGRIEVIVVTCSCGEQITIDCQYDEAKHA